MSFLYNNIAAITVAAAASVVAWIFGGARGDLLMPVVPWLFVFLVEVLLCYPQRHTGESLYDARTRVWSELKQSKIVWVAGAFLILLVIPFFNDGLCPGCDAALIAQGGNPRPPFKFLPFCVNRIDHLKVVMWFMIVLPSLIAVRHCLTRRGKRLVIELIVWNGFALAILGFVQGATGAPGPFWQTLPGGRSVEFFSTFGYPNMAGDYFVTLFGLAVAMWRDKYEQVRRDELNVDISERSGRDARLYGSFWKRHYFLLPAVLFFFAALNTLSRAAILLVSVTALVYFVHTLVMMLSRMRRSRRVAVGVWSMIVFGLLVFFAVVAMPSKIRKELNSLNAIETFDRVTKRADYHGKVAPSIWKDHPLFGVGGWGYTHFSVPKMIELKIPLAGNLQSVGGCNVHNDPLQFLVEHGLVGFGALVAIVFFLLQPVVRQWRAIVNDQRFRKDGGRPPRPIAIFALPAPVFFILLTALATLVHSFGDCPLRSCAVLDVFFISLAALPGFMPKPGEDALHHHHRHHHHHHH